MPVNMPWIRVCQVVLPFVCEKCQLWCFEEPSVKRVGGKTDVVPHICCTHKVGADVVRPLKLICYSAIICHFSTVINEVVACEQRCLNDPVVGLVSPIRVRLITGVSSQTSSQLEEAPI